MPENLKEQDGNGLQSVSDATLRQYLLSAVDEELRLSLDERLLVDDEFAQRVSLAESELIDDYAGGHLDAGQRELFTRRFLVTDERRDALRLATALTSFEKSEPAPSVVPAAREARPSWGEQLGALFGLRNPGLAFAGALAILIAAIGLVWFITRGSGQNQNRIASNPPSETQPQNRPQVEPSPALATAQATPDIKPQSKPSPERNVSPAVATFVLLPGALRSSGNMTRIAVPRGEQDVVRLNLILENPGDGPYTAEVANANGQTLLVKKDLKPHVNGQIKITFDVPARLIQTDDYQIKLQRKADGKLESVGRYYFRALPE